MTLSTALADASASSPVRVGRVEVDPGTGGNFRTSAVALSMLPVGDMGESGRTISALFSSAVSKSLKMIVSGTDVVPSVMRDIRREACTLEADTESITAVIGISEEATGPDNSGDLGKSRLPVLECFLKPPVLRRFRPE